MDEPRKTLKYTEEIVSARGEKGNTEWNKLDEVKNTKKNV